MHRGLNILLWLTVLGLVLYASAAFTFSIPVSYASQQAAMSTEPRSSAAQECECVIAGGGPAGLSCAILLAQRGYKNIHVLERNPGPDHFEVDKAYLYRIDGRGLRLTDRLGITERLAEVGCRTDEFLNISIVEHTSKVTTVPAPADPSRKAYWLPRRALIRFLVDRINEGYSPQIQIHWDTSIVSVDIPKAVQAMGGRGSVKVVQDGLKLREFVTLRIIGCDGMNSKVRLAMKEWSQQHGRSGKERSRFKLHTVPSPSAGLRFKILSLNRHFPIVRHSRDMTDPIICYSYKGRPHGPFSTPLRLGCLPYKMEKIPRTANIIAKPGAKIFDLSTAEQVVAFLGQELPQCALDEMIPEGEAARFAQSQGGSFPTPTYCLESQLSISRGQGGIVLLGDAIHYFPPDLGAGVNLAFEDVLTLGNTLEETADDWGKALPVYEQRRAPQSQAICRLIPIGFPHQYNHMSPLLKSLKLFGVSLRILLNKCIPGLIAPPVFFMAQDSNLDYATMYRRARRTTRIFQVLLSGLTILLYQQLGVKLGMPGLAARLPRRLRR